MKKTCTKCGEEKELELFIKNNKRKDGYSSHCKNCKKKYYYDKREYYLEKQKQYAKKNKEKINAYMRQWAKQNPKKIKQYKKNFFSRHGTTEYKLYKKTIQKWEEKKKNDQKYVLKKKMRDIVYRSITRKGYTKKSKTFDILGCSFKEFKQHLESQFQEGMTWDNYGINGWHIDHIYPLSKARDEEHLLELNHYTNLQPLWEKDNIAKGNRLDWSE